MSNTVYKTYDTTVYDRNGDDFDTVVEYCIEDGELVDIAINVLGCGNVTEYLDLSGQTDRIVEDCFKHYKKKAKCILLPSVEILKDYIDDDGRTVIARND